ncbi:pilus assembly protein [Salmonella enterica subsp. enterica serovar Chester]|nr:pilus assembly protein [Salmonella enterica subsp. enterica serovar Inganda]EDV0114382.1 pilus assembly protein [Salmonella enterica subsp. enterica]EJV0836025.1 pilus assembly protein [Salmonella enterica subsp. enterica serovar Chester]ELN8034312.1 pilus assembly protein [Salmonella enterica]
MNQSFLFKLRMISSNSGAASIEFSLILIPFLASILFIMELCRIMYLTAAIDLVLAESGRYISLEPSVIDYAQNFNKMLNDNIVLWPLLASGQSVDVSVYHCEKVSDLSNIASSCTMDDTTGKKILAMYSVNYQYKPLFFIFSAGFFDSLLSRKLIYIQEAKRG